VIIFELIIWAHRLNILLTLAFFATFRQNGIRCYFYIDDSLTMNQDKLKCKNESLLITRTIYLSKKNTKTNCNLYGFIQENTHLLDQILSNNPLVVSNREQSSNMSYLKW
jgi:hypothetical protein